MHLDTVERSSASFDITTKHSIH